jgi:hypothetical protein
VFCPELNMPKALSNKEKKSLEIVKKHFLSTGELDVDIVKGVISIDMVRKRRTRENWDDLRNDFLNKADKSATAVYNAKKAAFDADKVIDEARETLPANVVGLFDKEVVSRVYNMDASFTMQKKIGSLAQKLVFSMLQETLEVAEEAKAKGNRHFKPMTSASDVQRLAGAMSSLGGFEESILKQQKMVKLLADDDNQDDKQLIQVVVTPAIANNDGVV